VYVSTEEETQLRALAPAHGDITIPRLLIESALAPRDSTPMYDRRELLAELSALRRLPAGALARVANATGAVPVRQLEAKL
jgi:hypothetical protein